MFTRRCDGLDMIACGWHLCCKGLTTALYRHIARHGHNSETLTLFEAFLVKMSTG